MTHENSMNESEIRGLIDQVRDNSLTRKQFIRHMIGAGLVIRCRFTRQLVVD